MKTAEVDLESIEKMVRAFYATLIKDDLVGPFFIKALGDDLDSGKWREHYGTLDRFWLLMMTGEEGYRGDPYMVHAFMGTLTVEIFDRWLEIFYNQVHTQFTPKIADKFYTKGQTIARRFMQGLEIGEFASDEDDEY
ncbi:MAG: group III truncated hemoglobin [Sulfurovum sp.]|nr:group III truncated hemoglobin [Sulfurovum sp.]